MRILQLNHVAINVEDVERSAQFYARVLGLEPMARPAFTFPGGWFRIGPDQELHLIGRRPEHPTPPRERHFAFRVDSMKAAILRLQTEGWQYTGPQRRPDGAMQIFLRDPDGHVIELFTPPGELPRKAE